MLKLLSVKTRRPDGTREAFRRHYEERHVPLGLGFIDRFRWRKYARNHVVRVHAGRCDFDCLTEFWFASREDQESTRVFAASPEFAVLDEDDPRFLDVTKRFSCELAESLVAGERPPFDGPGTRRMAALFERPAADEPEAFARAVEREARRMAAQDLAPGTRVTLDCRVLPGPRPEAFAAIVSTWSAPGYPFAPSRWKGEREAAAVVDLVFDETATTEIYTG